MSSTYVWEIKKNLGFGVVTVKKYLVDLPSIKINNIYLYKLQ